MTPTIGMKFFDGISGTHTITSVDELGFTHTYMDGTRKCECYMYTHVFNKLLNQNVLWVL